MRLLATEVMYQANKAAKVSAVLKGFLCVLNLDSDQDQTNIKNRNIKTLIEMLRMNRRDHIRSEEILSICNIQYVIRRRKKRVE